MHTKAVSGNHSDERFHSIDQAGFWLTVVSGWKREINKVVARIENVNASAEVTAQIAQTAGALSELAENLDELSFQIGYHQLTLPAVDSKESEWKFTHSMLHERMRNEGEKIRHLLDEMTKLDKTAYKRFLC